MIGSIQRIFARLFKRRRSRQNARPPWYTGPPTFPNVPRYFQPPPPPITAQPHPSASSEAGVRYKPVLAGGDLLNHTRPIQKADDTRPIQAAQQAPQQPTEPTPLPQSTPTYDYLFPPPQPGDEDYLEFERPTPDVPPVSEISLDSGLKPDLDSDNTLPVEPYDPDDPTSPPPDSLPM